MNLADFFEQLGLSSKEQSVFMVLHRNGSLPVSSIASKAGLERTGTYYILTKLQEVGLVGYSEKTNVKVYFTKNGALEEYIRQKKEHFEAMEQKYTELAPTLDSLRLASSHTPHIQIYDGEKGVRQCFRDMETSTRTQELLEIRLIATDTFTQELGGKRVENYAQQFFDKLQQRNIHIQALVTEGGIIKEHLSKTSVLAEILKLPASRQASNIYLVGDSIFIVTFQETPVALCIQHQVIAELMHFLFDLLENKVNI